MQRVNIKNKFLIFLYSKIFYKNLTDIHTGKQSKIISIKGWRTMLIQYPSSGRATITPLFKWLDKKDCPECFRK